MSSRNFDLFQENIGAIKAEVDGGDQWRTEFVSVVNATHEDTNTNDVYGKFTFSWNQIINFYLAL